jgi:predicted DCC family thiol-disulfide oxidoreductase YuxK
MSSIDHDFKEKPVLLFDGYCNLCSSSVVFILKRERHDTLRFASLQSNIAREILDNFDLTESKPDSIVLIEDDQVFFQSAAALKVTKKLKWPWPLLWFFIIVPRFIRDAVYNYIAKNRYKWFGQKQQCFVPGRDMSYKFID